MQSSLCLSDFSVANGGKNDVTFGLKSRNYD